jgi:spermidine synthase
MASISGGILASSILYAAFFFSGFTALLYEIVWQRLLVRITGATMPATVAIFSLFMLGLALGSFFSAKYCEKSIRAWKMYALTELLVALMGLTILYLSEQSTLEWISGYCSASSGFVRANLVSLLTVLASVVVTIATAAMGAAFNFGVRALLLERAEIISRGYVDLRRGMERIASINQAYIWNVCGAAVGSIGGAFIFLPNLGLSNSAFFACAVNVLLAAGLWVGQSKFESAAVSPVEAERIPAKTNHFITIIVLIFSFSFVSMSLEVTWTRLLCLICGSSTYAVGSVLAAILVSLAAAAVITGRIANEPRFSYLLLSASAGTAALFLSFNLFALPYLSWSILWMQNSLARTFASPGLQFFLPRVTMAFVLISGTAFFLGLVTPILIKLLNKEQQSVSATAYALTASTAGSIFGALFTAFIVIPNDYFVSGIETAMVISVCALSLLGLVCLRVAIGNFNIKSMMSWGGWLILCSLLIVLIHPRWQPRLMSLGPSFIETSKRPFLTFDQFAKRYNATKEKCLFYKEGTSATVTVETNELSNTIYLKSNGKVESSLPIYWQQPAPTSDFKTQLFIGIVPVLCQPGDVKNLNALTIGFGSGITSGVLLSFDQIAHLTICEIEPAIYQCSHFFDNSNFRPLRKEWLESGRVSAERADARAYLNQNNALFDIIVSQPSEPWVSGSSDLFTLEFFRLAQSRVKPGGVFVQWLQLYCIDERLLTNLIATFHQVFPDTYILHPRNSGDIILIGVLDNKLPPEEFFKGIDKNLRESGMSLTVFETLKQAISPSQNVLDYDFILTPVDVASYLDAHNNVELNTDGRIATEYQLPQELLLSETNINNNIFRLKTVRARP